MPQMPKRFKFRKSQRGVARGRTTKKKYNGPIRGFAVTLGLGILTAVLTFIPYLGPALTALATGTAAFLQFGSITMALLVAGSSLVIATLVGVATPMTLVDDGKGPVAVPTFVSCCHPCNTGRCCKQAR